MTEIDPDLARYLPLLDVILPVPIPDNEFTSAMSGEIRGGNIRELLTSVLSFEARRAPLLLVLEDLHWFDSASWALLVDVQQKVRPILLALNTRPLLEPAPIQFKQIMDHPQTRLIKLEAMTLDDVEALVCQRLGVKSIPPMIGRLIREKSEGHPFFAEELAYAMRDSGILTIENHEARMYSRLINFEDLTLPDTLQAAITNRIDSLDPSQQLTLKVASVIGRIFALRALQAIHPIESDKPSLRDYMENLTRLSLILVESEIPGPGLYLQACRHPGGGVQPDALFTAPPASPGGCAVDRAEQQEQYRVVLQPARLSLVAGCGNAGLSTQLHGHPQGNGIPGKGR